MTFLSAAGGVVPYRVERSEDEVCAAVRRFHGFQRFRLKNDLFGTLEP